MIRTSVTDKYDQSYVQNIINNSRDKSIDSNKPQLSVELESESDLDDISTVPPNPLYQKNALATAKIVLPETKLIHHDKFWREQVNRSEGQNVIIGNTNDASQINLEEDNFLLSSESSTDLSFTPNKLKYRRQASIRKWTVSLSGSNLIITGYINDGRNLIRKICARRISRYIFHDHNNTVCSILGPNQQGADLPKYVQGKFKYGIPEDWLRVVDVWRQFIISGSPEKYKWPPVSETPIYNYNTNNYEQSDNSSIIHTNYNSLAAAQLKKKIAKLQTRLKIMLSRENTNFSAPTTNQINRLENININKNVPYLISKLNCDKNSKTVVNHPTTSKKSKEISTHPDDSEKLLSDESIHLELLSSERSSKKLKEIQPEIISEIKSLNPAKQLNIELKTEELLRNQLKQINIKNTNELRNHAKEASDESYIFLELENRRTAGSKTSDTQKAINDGQKVINDRQKEINDSRKSFKTYDNHVVASGSKSQDSSKFSVLNNVSSRKESQNKKESSEDKNIKNFGNIKIFENIGARTEIIHLSNYRDSRLKAALENTQIESEKTKNVHILNDPHVFRKPDNSTLKTIARRKKSMVSAKISEHVNEEILEIKDTRQEKEIKLPKKITENENNDNFLKPDVRKKSGRKKGSRKSTPEISESESTTEIYQKKLEDFCEQIANFTDSTVNEKDLFLKPDSVKNSSRKKGREKLIKQLPVNTNEANNLKNCFVQITDLNESIEYLKKNKSKKAHETEKIHECSPKRTTSTTVSEKSEKNVPDLQDHVFLTPAAEPILRGKKKDWRKNSVNNDISTSNTSKNNSNITQNSLQSFNNNTGRNSSNLTIDLSRGSSLSNSCSNTSVSSRGRIRVPTLSFWQGQRVSVCRSEVLIQTSRTEKCNIENFLSNTSQWSDSSTERRNTNTNQSNDSASSLSNVFKTTEPKISKLTPTNTQTSKINYSKDNDLNVSKSISPVKSQNSTSKVDKEMKSRTKRNSSPNKSKTLINKSDFNSISNNNNSESNFPVRKTRSQSKSDVRKELNYASSDETYEILQKESPALKKAPKQISAKKQLKNTLENGSNDLLLNHSIRNNSRKQLKYTSDGETIDVSPKYTPSKKKSTSRKQSKCTSEVETIDVLPKHSLSNKRASNRKQLNSTSKKETIDALPKHSLRNKRAYTKKQLSFTSEEETIDVLPKHSLSNKRASTKKQLNCSSEEETIDVLPKHSLSNKRASIREQLNSTTEEETIDVLPKHLLRNKKKSTKKQLNSTSEEETIDVLPKHSISNKRTSTKKQLNSTSEEETVDEWPKHSISNKRRSTKKQLKCTSEEETIDVMPKHSISNKRTSTKKQLNCTLEEETIDVIPKHSISNKRASTKKQLKYIDTSPKQSPNKKRLKTTEKTDKQSPVSPKTKNFSIRKQMKNISPNETKVKRRTRSKGKNIEDKISPRFAEKKQLEYLEESKSGQNYSLDNSQSRYNIRQNKRTTYSQCICDDNEIEEEDLRKKSKSPKKTRNDKNKNTAVNNFSFTQSNLQDLEVNISKRNMKNKNTLGLKNTTQFKVAKPRKLKKMLPLDPTELDVFVNRDKKKTKGKKVL